MSTYIKSCLYHSGKINEVTIFGYATNGIPGVEIVGLGRFGKILKEKIVFYLRDNKVRLPLKRYVLCLDFTLPDKADYESLKELQVPFLVLLLSLSQAIPIKKLSDCVTVGSIMIDGKFDFSIMSCPAVSEWLISKVNHEGFKIIGRKKGEHEKVLPIDAILFQSA